MSPHSSPTVSILILCNMLSGNKTLEGTGGVGLSDSTYTANRRRLLDIIDALHRTGYVSLVSSTSRI